jgi:hypothetical protein
MRRGELPLADAIRFMDEAEFLMQRGTFEIESSRVLKLAACSGIERIRLRVRRAGAGVASAARDN